jgi:hypothetical protein
MLAVWDAETRRILVQDQPEQKVIKTPISTIKGWVWWCVPVIPAKWEL